MNGIEKLALHAPQDIRDLLSVAGSISETAKPYRTFGKYFPFEKMQALADEREIYNNRLFINKNWIPPFTPNEISLSKGFYKDRIGPASEAYKKYLIERAARSKALKLKLGIGAGAVGLTGIGLLAYHLLKKKPTQTEE